MTRDGSTKSKPRRKPAAEGDDAKDRVIKHWQVAERLAAIACDEEEIAFILGCSVETVQQDFQPAMRRGTNQRNLSVLREQFRRAMKGDEAMLRQFSVNCHGLSRGRRPRRG